MIAVLPGPSKVAVECSTVVYWCFLGLLCSVSCVTAAMLGSDPIFQFHL